jgi:hypothetical protein
MGRQGRERMSTTLPELTGAIEEQRATGAADRTGRPPCPHHPPGRHGTLGRLHLHRCRADVGRGPSNRQPHRCRSTCRIVNLGYGASRTPLSSHLGRNESTPSTAPPSTNRAGLILYCSRISKTPPAIAAVSTPKIAAFAMVKQPASSRPIETGASPC